MFYACQNISAQDFGPDDIVNILEVILNKDNYTTNEKGAYNDNNNIEDNTDVIESENENTGTVETEGASPPVSDIPPSPESSESSNTNTVTDTVTVTVTTEPVIITEPVPPTEPEKPEETSAADDSESSIYYSTGAATVINILNIFSDAPEKFREIPYPEDVPMIDSLKKNIKNLSDFSPRDFKELAFYIATTEPKLFTPLYGGGMLSDARRYRTELVDAECNTDITCLEPKDDLIREIKLAVQTDEFYADILCLPFDIQSELIKNGLLMNLKKTPFLNINAEYYNASATEAFTVNGNIFGLVSDLTFDPANIYAIFYNKSLVKKFNLTDPFEIYKNRGWNYDGMFNISKELTAAAADFDNPEGFVYYSVGFDQDDNDAVNGLFIGSGSKYFTKSNYSYPSLNFAGEKTNKLIDAMSKIFSPPADSGMSKSYDVSDTFYPTNYMGSVLFSMLKLDVIPNITDSAFDWGILPVPALSGYQNADNKPYSSTDRNALCISILKGTRNTEACGIVVSALSSVSNKMLKDIYVREQMTFHLRDIDSVMVLGDIINNITFNQYHAFSTMPEIYSSTVGLLKDAANRKIDFSESYNNHKTNLSEFFKNSDFFDRN